MDPEHTVHIVEDNRAVRRSLECLLAAAGFKPIAYGSAIGFLDAAPGASAGCLLLNVRMPDIDGLELQDWLNRLGFALPIVVMTGHGDVATAMRAMKAGAVDFIEKPCDDDRLLDAIEQALMTSRQAARSREIAKACERIAALSRREKQVLDALVAGRPNKVIAYDLGLSVRTVEVHRARMLERLGTRSTAEAIALAVLAASAQPPRHQQL
jgi:two-component system, LuxR family, response regulator FixJ